MARESKTDAPICEQCGETMINRGSLSEAGRRRWKCTPCGYSTTGRGESQLGYDQIIARARAKEIRQAWKDGCRKYVATCAQDTTNPNGGFDVLRKYCQYNGAKLIVLPVHYKNVSLFTGGQKYLKDWDDAFKPFIVDEALKLGPVSIYGGIKILAMDPDPLRDAKGLNKPRSNSIVYGHPKQMVAGLTNRRYTTGSSTISNYSRSVDNNHHVEGGIVIEILGTRTFIRQLCYDGEGLYDLDNYYTANKVTKNHPIAALVFGEGHVKFMDPAVKDALYTGPDSVNKILKPEYLFHHDLLDCYFGGASITGIE